MLSGIYHNPTKIYFGQGSLATMLRDVEFKHKNILIAYGGRSADNLGIVKVMADAWKDQLINIHYLRGITPNPDSAYVYEGINICRKESIDFIIAIGGGSVIDTAKSISIGAPYEGDFFDFFFRVAMPDKGIPLGVVSTISGSGSESSDSAVITKDDLKIACASKHMLPMFAVLDPEYTLSVPKKMTAYGIVDAISHVIERYFTSEKSVSVSTELSEGLIRRLISLGRKVVQNPGDYDIRSEIMWSSKLAHDTSVCFGRKGDWAAHTIAHEIGGRYGLPHGAILSVVVPAWMQHVQPYFPDLFANFGKEVFGIRGKSNNKIGQKGIGMLKSFFSEMGMPKTLEECVGQDVRKDLQSIAECCSRTTASGTIGNLKRLTVDNVIAVLTMASS